MKSPFVLRSTHDEKVTALEASSRGFSDKYYDLKVDYYNTQSKVIALGHEKGRLESITSSLECKVKSLEHGFAIERSELLGSLMVKDDEISQLVDQVKGLQKYNHDLIKIGMKLESDLTAARAPKTRKKKTAA